MTDGPNVNTKLGNLVKREVPNLLHIICVCHNAHNLLERVKDKFVTVQRLVFFLGTSFKNNKNHRLLWTQLTKLRSYPGFSLTRWGSYISCATFLHENLEKISKYVKAVEREKKVSTFSLVDNELLKAELEDITHYSAVIPKITSMEKNGVECLEKLDVYNTIGSLCIDQDIVEAWKEIRKKSKDLGKLRSRIKKERPGTEYSLKYVDPMTVNVERSFSNYGLIFSSIRRSLKVGTIFSIFVLLAEQ